MFEFDFLDPVKIRIPGSGTAETCPKAVVVGMLTRPHAELLLQGALRSFVIMFQPAGMSALFPVNLCELTNRGFDAHSVMGKPIAELEERLANCRSFAMRVGEADAFLSRRIPYRADADLVSFATDMILACDGRVRISDLATDAGIGSRQLEREFGSHYGMSPKLYARITRFQAALDSKARSSVKSWTDVAHEFGYHDQMHMIHDFEEFTGETPTQTLGQVEQFFRRQIEAIQVGMGTKEPRFFPRFVI
jgi:AraC-like DNA-binding protein